ncbi:hypothetical protein [Enterococcus ureilyticus]|nr:hypothetical protein [Enterococcus ureilyticus]MBM7690345.1 flagellar basal body-associated protein FliL [Enterococcus ureilyticus]
MSIKKKKTIIISIIVIIFLGIISCIGWLTYEYFRIPSSAETTAWWDISKQPEIINMGKLNNNQWTIAQYKDVQKPETKYRNKQRYNYNSSDVEVGENHVATFNRTYTTPTPLEFTTSTTLFEIFLYDVSSKKDSEPRKVDLLAKDKKLIDANYMYFLNGFSIDDKYLIIYGTDGPEKSQIYYYLDVKDHSIKTEDEVDAKYRYKEPDTTSYKIFYTEGAQGASDIWVDTTSPATYLSSFNFTDKPNVKNKFIQKYPEIKEYYGSDTYFKINYTKDAPSPSELMEELRSGYEDED